MEYRDLGEFNYVRITLGKRVYRGRVLSASNYGNRNWIPNDPQDWYIEFRETDDKGEPVEGSAHYLKQIQDGFGDAVIEFAIRPFTGG